MKQAEMNMMAISDLLTPRLYSLTGLRKLLSDTQLRVTKPSPRMISSCVYVYLSDVT